MATGFVERLAAARIGDTFNQYAESALRRERLARYLRDAAPAQRVLLVGEAPGYRGARVSGIPFTSERQLTGTGPAEATATIVRRTLAELGVENDVVPLEPRARPHPGTAVVEPAARRASEIEQSEPFLRRARRAAAASSRSAGSRTPGSAAPYVRHPSHGGAAAFRSGITAALLG